MKALIKNLIVIVVLMVIGYNQLYSIMLRSEKKSPQSEIANKIDQFHSQAIQDPNSELTFCEEFEEEDEEDKSYRKFIGNFLYTLVTIPKTEFTSISFKSVQHSSLHSNPVYLEFQVLRI